MAKRNPTRLTPEQRAEVARRNGAKSRGPKTDTGKAVSSANAVKHGLYTRHIVLSTESPEVYARFRQGYLDDWQPVGPRERDLVLDIVNARWRMRRVVLMETAAIDCALARQRKAVDAEFEVIDDAIRVSLAYSGLHGDPSPAMTLLGRAESRLLRIIDRSTKMLHSLQSARKAAANMREDTSPHPDSTHGPILAPPPGPEPGSAPSTPHDPAPQQPQNLQNEPNALEPAAGSSRQPAQHRHRRHRPAEAPEQPGIQTVRRIGWRQLLQIAFLRKRTRRAGPRL